ESHSLTDTHGVTSAPGAIWHTSVNTAPHPPSAFMPRNFDCMPGLSEPAPLHCGTCQKRLGRVLGPRAIGSNRTSYFGSRGMAPTSLKLSKWLVFVRDVSLGVS